MNRILTICITLLLLIGLTGCGQSESPDDPSPDSGTTMSPELFMTAMDNVGLNGYYMAQTVTEETWEKDESTTGMSAWYGAVVPLEMNEGHDVGLYAMMFDYTNYEEQAETRKTELTDTMSEDFEYFFSDIEDGFLIILAGNEEYVDMAKELTTALGYTL